MRARWMTLLVFVSFPAWSEPLAPGRFDPSWNGLDFGVTRERVIAFLKERVHARYEVQIRDTRDVAVQDRLKRAREAEIAQVGSDFVEFTGQPTGWDISVVRGEFAHRTGEAMLHLQEGKNHYYLFFANDIFYKLIWTGVDRPVTRVVEDLSRVYGPPAHVEHQDTEARTGVRLARWEQGLLDVSVEDRTRLYQCFMVRWVLRAADEAVRAEWEKARTASPAGTNPIVREAAEPQGPDTSNPVDEILGRTPPPEQPAPAPPKKPKKTPKK